MDGSVNINETLMEHIFRMFAILRRGPRPRGGDQAKGGGRPSAQNRILVMLLESNGISQRDMTTLLRLRPQSISETLSKLEAAGLVERRQSDIDKRIFNIFLTPQGKERAAELLTDRPDFAAEFLSVLTEEEKEQLLCILSKLTEDEEEEFDSDF
ncbi:MAG: MarR family transcriptional regulator [Papillibacter sp.]|jgi:DNA-binding MarR family transcriptional regulator|nr:MarR family transcriptional regulator [Papillibacter sp.]